MEATGYRAQSLCRGAFIRTWPVSGIIGVNIIGNKAFKNRPLKIAAIAFATVCLSAKPATAQFSRLSECIWQGQGFQNESPPWTIRLVIRNGFYSIDYPSLACGGTWTLVSETETSAVFTEHIIYGKQYCIGQGTVELYRKDQDTLRYFYFLSSGEIIAYADLNCSRRISPSADKPDG